MNCSTAHINAHINSFSSPKTINAKIIYGLSLQSGSLCKFTTPLLQQLWRIFVQNIVRYKNIEFFFAFCSSQFTTKNHEQRKRASWGWTRNSRDDDENDDRWYFYTANASDVFIFCPWLYIAFVWSFNSEIQHKAKHLCSQRSGELFLR